MNTIILYVAILDLPEFTMVQYDNFSCCLYKNFYCSRYYYCFSTVNGYSVVMYFLSASESQEIETNANNNLSYKNTQIFAWIVL